MPSEMKVSNLQEQTPLVKLQRKLQDKRNQVKADRLRVDPKLGSQELLGQLLELQVREVVLEEVLREIKVIQNGSEDPNAETDFLGADDLPPFHSEEWVED